MAERKREAAKRPSNAASDDMIAAALVRSLRHDRSSTLGIEGQQGWTERTGSLYHGVEWRAARSGPFDVLAVEAATDVMPFEAWRDRIVPGGTLIVAMPPRDTEDRGEAVVRARASGFAAVAFEEGATDAPAVLLARVPFADSAAATSIEPTRRRASGASQGPAPVSVVIPLYNHARYIERALDSVFSQSRPPKEVIVIDDGSSDDGPAIAERMCERQPGAVFWRQPNRGAHNTINTGLLRSTQPYLAILNSDDFFYPKRLELALDRLAQENVALVSSAINFVDETETAIENPWYWEALDYLKQVGNTSLALLNGNYLMTTSNLVLDRAVLSKVGLFRDFRYAHDLDLFVRVLAAGFQFDQIDEPLLAYRYHAANTIKENHTNVRTEWAFIIASAMRGNLAHLTEGMSVNSYLDGLNEIAFRHSLGRGVLTILQAMVTKAGAEMDMNLLNADQELLDIVRRRLS